MSFSLAPSNQSPLAALIRKAIGAADDEDIEVATPTFDRPPNWDIAMLPPTDAATWKKLECLSRDDLRALGCRPFCLFSTTPPADPNACRGVSQWFYPIEDDHDETGATHELWLYPAEWYQSIPNGLPVTDINGCVELFEAGRTDDDRRFGLLAYGAMIPFRQASR